MHNRRDHLWRDILSRVLKDFAQLPEAERRWIAVRLPRIEALQQQLDRLFSSGNGDDTCAGCQGACCAHGHNHVTLVNLLSLVQKKKIPPPADFSQTCPFLSVQGCTLAVESRPYNCVTFICDKIEDALSDQQRERFYQLDQELRACYQEFSLRYRGAALTGLLIREQRHPGESFFILQPSAEEFSGENCDAIKF